MARRRIKSHDRKPWKKGQRVFIYIRVSRVGDREDTLISDEVQESQCRKWAEREGLTVVGDPIKDIDESGRTSANRKIDSTIERIEKGEADGIVVWKISRWGRNLTDSMLNIAELQDAGGFIGSATENLDDIETPTGRFSLSTMLAIAQLQSDQIGETWENIHEYRRDRGLPHNGGPRFGYVYTKPARDADPSTAYKVDETTGPWLAKCYRDFIAGKSVTSLMKELNRNGIMTTKGGKFSYRSLQSLMDSGFGAGLLVDRREKGPDVENPNECTFMKGAHPAVIDEQTWQAYVRKRAVKVAPREASAVHRLTGLMYCGHCNRKLTIQWKSYRLASGELVKYRSFRCPYTPARNSGGATCESPVIIAQDRLEAVVLAWLKQQYDGEGRFSTATERVARAAVARTNVESMSKELARLRRLRLRAAQRELEAEDDSEADAFKEAAADYKRQIDDLEARKAELEVEADVSEIPMADAFGALIGTWERSQASMLNAALRTIICRIQVYRSATPMAPDTDRVKVIGRWEAECPETRQLVAV